MLFNSFLFLLQAATILSLHDDIAGGNSIVASASHDHDSVTAPRTKNLRTATKKSVIFNDDNAITRKHKKKHKDDKKDKKDNSFDLYVLSMSHQPEFCFKNREKSFDGCENPIEAWRGSLTIHGLWPERKDGTWPSTCTNEKFDPDTISKIGQDRFNTLWPNVKAPSSSSAYYSFWNHEWTKHGTCSGLSQFEYFNTTLNHCLETPAIVRERYGGSISKKELMDAYDIDVVLVCSGEFLSEVRTCVGRDNSGDATVGVDCIIEVEDEGNCGDEIKIAKFYVEDNPDKEEIEKVVTGKNPIIMSS